MEYPVCSTYVRSRVVVVVVVAVVVAVALNSMRVRVRVREKTRAEKLGVTIASAGFRKKCLISSTLLGCSVLPQSPLVPCE